MPIQDYSTIDFTVRNPQSITNNPNYVTTLDPNVAFDDADANAPAGLWAVGGNTTSAGQIVLAKFFAGYLSANTTIGTHLAAMNANTIISNAASKFSAQLKIDVSNMGTSVTKSYADLVTLAGGYTDGTGLTATQLVELVLPNETATNAYTKTTYGTLGTTIDQFVSSKLTDNSVLQEKFANATSNRNTIVDAMTALIRSQQQFLLTLAKGI